MLFGHDKFPGCIVDLLHERGRIVLSSGFRCCNVLLEQIQQRLVDLVVACMARTSTSLTTQGM